MVRLGKKYSCMALGALLSVVPIAGLAWYLVTVPDPFYREPAPVRTLIRNRHRIEAYIESIYAGRIPRREGKESYYILDVLVDNNVSYVRKKGECIVISFDFMPTDPIPELVFSPKGVGGLPDQYKPNQGRPPFLELRQIDANWFYCRWDYP